MKKALLVFFLFILIIFLFLFIFRLSKMRVHTKNSEDARCKNSLVLTYSISDSTFIIDSTKYRFDEFWISYPLYTTSTRFYYDIDSSYLNCNIAFRSNKKIEGSTIRLLDIYIKSEKNRIDFSGYTGFGDIINLSSSIDNSTLIDFSNSDSLELVLKYKDSSLIKKFKLKKTYDYRNIKTEKHK